HLEMPAPRNETVPDFQNEDAGLLARTGDGDQVPGHLVGAQVHFLAFLDRIEIADLVPDAHGLLETFGLGGLAHAPVELLMQIAVPALQEKHSLIYKMPVGLGCGEMGARGVASLEVITQAGPDGLLQRQLEIAIADA